MAKNHFTRFLVRRETGKFPGLPLHLGPQSITSDSEIVSLIAHFASS